MRNHSLPLLWCANPDRFLQRYAEGAHHEAEGGPSGTNHPVLDAQDNEEVNATVDEQYPADSGDELRQLLESILSDFNKVSGNLLQSLLTAWTNYPSQKNKPVTAYVRPACRFPISEVRTPMADSDSDNSTDEIEVRCTEPILSVHGLLTCGL